MQFRAVNSYEEAEIIFNTLPPTISLDTETTGLNPRDDQILRFVVSPDGEIAYSFRKEYLPILLTRRFEYIYAQNFKFDWAILYHHGIDLTDTPRIDAMLLHHLIDENADHGLGAMVKERYDDGYKDEFWAKYKTYESAPPEEALAYECKDAIYTYRLCQLFANMVEPRLIDHVHRLAHSLYLTELRGVRIDQPLMEATRVDMGGRIDTYLPALREEFLTECTQWELDAWFKAAEKLKTPKGRANTKRPTFNFGSGQQMQWLIYDALGAPITKKTKAGAPSTDYDAIESLLGAYPRLKTYHDYIEIKTIFGTFVEGLLERVEDGRVYPSFNVNGTATRRISHSNPNLGNQPKEGPYRNFYLPDEGDELGGSDFEQLEIVIEANLTGDKNLAKIIMEGASKHDITAQGLKIPRDLAKTVNFALGYHCGVYKLKSLLKCSAQEAQYQYDKYWELYSGVRDLKLLTDAEVDAGLPIKNLFGCFRHLPATFGKDWEREAAKRQAYNFKIQGVGAEFTNLALYRTSERLEASGRGRAMWSVHDEVLISARKQHIQEEIAALASAMSGIGKEYGFKLPLSAKPYGPLKRWAKA